MEFCVDRVEVRLLGPLRVRRADGSAVDPRELRTGKTADLLRLLAIRSNDTVPVDTILEALWPRVDRTKGLASLRTAASQIRRVLQQNCIVNQYDGLTFGPAWVDTVAFTQLSNECHGFALEQQYGKVVTVAREAEALYVEELRSHDPSLTVLAEERLLLRDLHLRLLLDAADAAVELRWFRDGVDFARRALNSDPYSERAFRALMKSHAGVGETRRALAAFEQCRQVLAEDLGADPSPQTRAVHVQVLCAQPSVSGSVPFVGRLEEQSWLLGIADRCLTESRPGLVVLSGDAGVGKTALARHVAAQLSVRVVHHCCTDERESLSIFLRRESLQSPVVVLLEDFDQLSPSDITLLGNELLQLTVPMVVIATGTGNAEYDGAVLELRCAGRLHEQAVGALSRDEVRDLAAAALAGAPGPEVLDLLLDETGGHPKRAIALLDDWLSRGMVVSTTAGLALMPSEDRARVASGQPRELARAYEHLSADLLRVLALAAILGGRLRASTLSLLDGYAEDVVANTLHELADLSLLELDNGDYIFRGPWLRNDVVAWLRPAERRRLHGLVANRAPLDPAQRIQHWLAAGEPEQARDVAIPAARDALAAHNFAEARDYLLAVRESCDQSSSDPGHRVVLLELTGDVAVAMGCRQEASEAYQVGAAVARMHGLHDSERLLAKHAGLDSPAPFSEQDTSEQPVQVRDLLIELDWDPSRAASASEERLLRNAVDHADRVGDAYGRGGYRLLLADAVLTPRRALGEARRWAEEARALSVDPATRALATAAVHRPAVLLGGSARAFAPLEQAWREVCSTSDVDAQAEVGVLLCLATHDLGLPQLPETWAAVEALAIGSRRRAGWDWLTARVLGERGELAAATAATAGVAVSDLTPLASQLRGLALANVERELSGRNHLVARMFADVAAQGQLTGCTLVVPEATAWLAEVLAATDVSAAGEQLDQIERSMGEVSLGRERCARLLAVAAIRAAIGKTTAAVDMAEAAVQTARLLGLVFLQARALSALAGYLREQGHEAAAADADVRSTLLLREAGAEVAATRRAA